MQQAKASSDPPAKVLDEAGNGRTLMDNLSQVIGNTTQQLQIVSPYFVPTDAGVHALVALRASGVQIQILTNSLEATDVAAVHAGYAKHRKALLQAGAQLFELRRRNVSMTLRHQ